MKKNIKLSVIALSVSWMFFSTLNAAELEQKSLEKTELFTSNTAERERITSSQRIFINPETGEIDKNPAQGIVAEAAKQISAKLMR